MSPKPLSGTQRAKGFYVRSAYSDVYINTRMSEHEPEATVYTAVAELERQFYTREEIADALRNVADDTVANEEHA